MSFISKQDALRATLAYADVFGHILTKRELTRWFLFYPVSGIRYEEKRAAQRQSGHEECKWETARRVSRWLSFIPSVDLVGVTGGLAMDHAGADDDIDLFIIAADGTLWMTRFLAILLTECLGVRRRRHDTAVANKICLNMFMSVRCTGLPVKERDCYSAHEVLQMVPLWERKGAYKRFLFSNRWVARYLPNAWREKNHESRIMKYGNTKHKTTIHNSLFIIRIFEPMAKIIQVWYMKKHRTREIISDTVLRFHPRDARVWVKRRFARRLAKYNIPLDKVFYAG